MEYRIILKLAPGQDAKSVTFEGVIADNPHQWGRNVADQMGLKLIENRTGWECPVSVSRER